MSLGHPAGQTGVYRPVFQGFPVFYLRKTDRKGHFCRHTSRVSQGQGAVKGVYLKGPFAQSRLFYREMDCPVRSYRDMDCPVQWSLATPSATPSALESQSRAEQGSVVANPICKCRRHKAGHLQVRVAVGRRSTCVLKEAPLNKGPLGFPHKDTQAFSEFLCDFFLCAFSAPYH